MQIRVILRRFAVQSPFCREPVSCEGGRRGISRVEAEGGVDDPSGFLDLVFLNSDRDFDLRG